MTIPMILAPLFVLVLMTFVLGILLAGVRAPLLTRGEIRPETISLRAAELAAARASGRQFVPEPVRTAGAVLRADDPRDDHASTPTSCSW